MIVTGKGGTGKSSVSAALALAAQARGLRVLAAELSEDEVLPRLIAGQREPVGYAGRELRPGLRGMRIDPFAALAEYLGLQLGVPALVERVLASRAFRQLMEASPGCSTRAARRLSPPSRRAPAPTWCGRRPSRTSS